MSRSNSLISPEILADGIVRRDSRCLARAISWVEDQNPGIEAVIHAARASRRPANVLGVTGPPGAGKSTLTDAIVTSLRREGRRVGLLLVDPSSPLTGGAILGDRVRLPGHAGDPDVFIRSMSNRGHLGGLSPGTAMAAALMESAGFDWIIIETVGTGQAETEIATLADSVLLVLVPGLGDEIQLMKAGIMEIADIFVVNKSDREGAGRLAAELRLQVCERDGWTSMVVSTTATTAQGINDLRLAIETHQRYLATSGKLAKTRAARRQTEFVGALRGCFDRAISEVLNGSGKSVLVGVLEGELDPYASAAAVWQSVLREGQSRQ